MRTETMQAQQSDVLGHTFSGELLPPTCPRAATILRVWPSSEPTPAVSHSPPPLSIAYNRLTILSQSPDFFRQVGFSNAFTISSILFAVKIPTNIFVMLTNDYFGRRSIVLFCVTSCVLTLTGISVLGFVKTNDSTKVVLIVLACFWVAGNNILG